MSNEDCESQDCIETRTERALTECMTVLPDHGRAEDAPGLFVVVGENENGQYLVDARTGSCECKDAKYRDPEGGCKHLRRCRIATGESPVPAGALDEITVDSTFGVHVDASPKFATADGGIIDAESGEEISDENTGASIWSDPKVEVDKYGKPTGDHYVTCQDCGIEVVTALTDCASHRENCRFE
jgi:hypothetical protein